jgi:hypothetical protein
MAFITSDFLNSILYTEEQRPNKFSPNYPSSGENSPIPRSSSSSTLYSSDGSNPHINGPWANHLASPQWSTHNEEEPTEPWRNIINRWNKLEESWGAGLEEEHLEWNEAPLSPGQASARRRTHFAEQLDTLQRNEELLAEFSAQARELLHPTAVFAALVVRLKQLYQCTDYLKHTICSIHALTHVLHELSMEIE